MRRLVFAIALIVVAAAGGLLLLGRSGSGAGGASATPSLPAVPPSSEVVADGRVVPIRIAELSVGTPGEITEVAVAEGDAVTSGQRLIFLDDTAAAAGVAAAKAAADAAAAAIDQAKAARAQAVALREAAAAAVDQARAGVTSARAGRDQLPARAPSAQKRVASANVTAAQASLDGARANLRAATGARDAAGAGVVAAEAELARAVAGVTAAERAAADTVVTAPFAGTVASLDARLGEHAAPGAVLVRIADTSSWRIETTNLDETTVARVAAGDAVSITFDGLPGVTIAGTVTSVSLYGSSSQGDIVYRAVITPGTIPEGLRWNMTATVTVSTGQ